jgi:hypothetical protein
MKNGNFFEMYTMQKMFKHVSNSYTSGWNWVRPEREDDARPHRNVPELEIDSKNVEGMRVLTGGREV